MRIVRRQPAAAEPPGLDGIWPALLQRVFAQRGISRAEELDLSLQRLLPPHGLKGLVGACELLEQALRAQWHILVVGDFDADGATSTTLCVAALRAFGAERVSYLVPDRFRFGYGLTPAIVAEARMLAPDLVITVDNGISSHEGVAAARAAGMRVLVTDHHLPGQRLPDADAIVNPNQPGCGFESKALAGVGVIFYTLLGLRAHLRNKAVSGVSLPRMDAFLDLVALGTVADVVPLDRNNRILVAQGLRRIREGRTRPGVQALFRVAGRACGRAVTADLGFAIGPRLNAAGRLEDMSIGIECLLADEQTRAFALAQRLDELNRERRELEGEMSQQARALVDKLDLGAALPAGLALFDPSWHVGVVGLVASRIKAAHHRPVVAFAPEGEASLKGSARSIPGVHIRDVLDAIAARRPGLITRFGGHAMAAGLTLPSAHLEAFRAAFAAEVEGRVTSEQLRGAILSDGPLDAREITLANALALREAAPWGQGFPEPCFDGMFEVLRTRVVGERHLKLVLRAPYGHPIEAIAFNAADEFQVESGAGGIPTALHVAYRLDVNEYRGEQRAQLVVEHWQLASASPPP